VLARMIAANSPVGVFETMRADMTQVPVHGRCVVRSGTVLAGGTVAEGAADPIRRFAVTELGQTMSKCVCEVAITTESMLQSPELAQAILARALPEALNRAVDIYFVGQLQAQEVGDSSGEVNPSWANVLNDLEELMRLVRVGSASRLFFVMAPAAAKYLARIATENGIESVRFNGGSIFGIEIITAQNISGLTLADGGVELRSSDETTTELSDAGTGSSTVPNPASVNFVNAFQSGYRVLRAERRLNARVIDTSGVATLAGIAWGAGADSPAGS
jgi:hypothetical protein